MCGRERKPFSIRQFPSPSLPGGRAKVRETHTRITLLPEHPPPHLITPLPTHRQASPRPTRNLHEDQTSARAPSATRHPTRQHLNRCYSADAVHKCALASPARQNLNHFCRADVVHKCALYASPQRRIFVLENMAMLKQTLPLNG